ncbi:MAG TPA: glycoside hydrolase family 3 C-terminal domain-containing protein [Verrucomicrobiae bacterium]|nr:glycoside hydrolase family 3 C-terminal domain-containing protein [Verrucomicrobiae bacterium]
MKTTSTCLKLITSATLLLAGWLVSGSGAFAADEICVPCGLEVNVTGVFSHHKSDASTAIEGAGDNAAAFLEDINGDHFTVSIGHLPAGKYNISIGEVETLVHSAGERVFNVTVGDTTLATNFDIFATAGAQDKVCYIEGTVEHEDDSIKGPLTISFTSRMGNAKFNTIKIMDSSGASVFSVKASELADAFTAAATRIPDVSGPVVWRDPSKPLNERINDLISRMSLAEKVAQLRGGQTPAPAIERLGLPSYTYWNEALHGVANNGIATVFPEPIGGSCAWDPDLFQQEGHIIGVEGRAKYNAYANAHDGNSSWWHGLTFWTPNLNIFRDPRWGRGQETYGEDPFLTATLAVPFIQGIQGDNPKYMLAMACAKHYAVHNGPEALRHQFDAEPSARDLYETYLPQFQAAVEQGHVGGVMGAYSALYGVPDCASSFLLTDLLRKQWGFQGYVVSDCGAIGDISGAHHYVDSPMEAAAAAVKAGCDLTCGTEYNALVQAVQQNLLTEKDVDRALYYTLWTRFKLGLFDPTNDVPYSTIGMDQNDTPEHRAVALKLAEESVVLLKNDGVLPLDRSKLKRIAVIGPNADSTEMLHGNYNGTASHPVSILNGIRQAAGPDIEVTYSEGCQITTNAGRGFGFGFGRRGRGGAPARPAAELQAEALSNAANADLVIYVGGITPSQEGEQHDRSDIELPEVQQGLVQALYATGKPVVMVNCSGSDVAFPWEAGHLPAILQAFYPGEQGGRAVGEILFGDVNPSGHLTVTFYKATTDLPAFTNYAMADRTYKYYDGQPLYAFGHGLSYTKFDFSSGKLNSAEIPASGTAKVTFTVKNTGSRDGDEVAQVYFRHVNSNIPQPKLALCGFTRVQLKQGESKQVTVEIPAERLRYWDTDKKQYVVAPGDYEFLVGAASDDIRLKLPMTISGS